MVHQPQHGLYERYWLLKIAVEGRNNCRRYSSLNVFRRPAQKLVEQTDGALPLHKPCPP